MASIVRRALLATPTVYRNLARVPTISTTRLQSAQLKCTPVMSRNFCSADPKPKKDTVTITFVDRDHDRIQTTATVGQSLLDVAIDNDVDLEGACEGTLACSTCHLIFSEENYKQLPDKPTDEELDMLDLAYGLMDTSRLGCQVIVTKDMDGWEIQVPEGVADAREP